ncbi:MAG: bifunctional oligoribonuclease/PAP phosphatase NrnA [Chlamydiae bacterium]|nr:bifunctional oligoribonuclease/PAP phosphatase NrnA [Chlamydiota bacterium]MBI3266607.1 bifunctional oligoribonuclease/PAP phosphatase NrnA [Chlamydiota bacterium]
MSTEEKLLELEAAVKGCHGILILTHDNPDPDSLSSAATLRYILAKKFKIRSKIAYGGIVGRAENRAMVQFLKIPASPLNEELLEKYHHFALLDTQPRTGNNSLPHSITPTIVIDHHPPRKTTKGAFLDIRENYGATATLLTEYLFASGLEIPATLATALFYGLSSETQNLGREAEEVDRQAYLSLFPYTHKRILSRIEHPKLSRDYFLNLSQALQNAFTYRNVIVSKLGIIQNPDHVPFIADLLLRLERVSWSLVLGQFEDKLLLSVRTSQERANAGKLVQKMVHPKGTAGGHGMIAGGKINCPDIPPEELLILEDELIQKFIKSVTKQDVLELKALLE